MKVFGVTGWKNSGKTSLVERLVAELTSRGLVVSTIKHAHHAADVDHEGTDTYRHRAAGARQVILSSPKRWALMSELREDDEPSLAELVAQIDHADVVLVEGFKSESHPKIEAYRQENGTSLIAAENGSIVAVAAKGDVETNLPVLDLDDTASVADFLLHYIGLGVEAKSKKLRNDCFALPPGVDWVPVDEAKARLRSVLSVVDGIERVALTEANGRVLAGDAIAKRSNPPAPNSAVDGYGFAHASLGDGDAQRLPLVDGRAAAGVPFDQSVPAGAAIRILTGAILPDGVDTVVLEEDVQIADGEVAFSGTVKPKANTRKAGEDVKAGEVALAKGHVMRPPDQALLAALGIHEVAVHKRLRVGVLSTGDELREVGMVADATHHIYDANRPMLLSMLDRLGYEPVDLGVMPDDPVQIRQALDRGATKADVIFTSGGASAGDEDHVSKLLRDEGNLSSWRIALKPGRPLALALWQGVPVFGLPGNPVAAFVCGLIFGVPAMAQMSGAGWREPLAFTVPAAFSKTKKPGRREYLRARLDAQGHAEVFQSEGSGRISGLSWAEGLVELPDDAMDVKPGVPVRFIPYSSFGI